MLDCWHQRYYHNAFFGKEQGLTIRPKTTVTREQIKDQGSLSAKEDHDIVPSFGNGVPLRSSYRTSVRLSSIRTTNPTLFSHSSFPKRIDCIASQLLPSQMLHFSFFYLWFREILGFQVWTSFSTSMYVIRENRLILSVGDAAPFLLC